MLKTDVFVWLTVNCAEGRFRLIVTLPRKAHELSVVT